MRGRRLERALGALRDGELVGRQRERLEAQLASDSVARARLDRIDVLGRAIQTAWSEGPAAPGAADLMRAIRPELARIDHELLERPTFWPTLGQLADWIRPLRVPAFAGAAAAAVFLMFNTLPTVQEPTTTAAAPVATTPVTTTAEMPPDETIYDLAEDSGSVVILEGDSGETIIWVVEDDDQISQRAPLGVWS